MNFNGVIRLYLTAMCLAILALTGAVCLFAVLYRLGILE